jgi:CubicO group peptidase (beta-lactamase class C family)
MDDTKTPLSKFDRDRLVKIYYSGITGALPVENLNALGAGGLYSSAEDLCTFAATFMNNSNGILSRKSLKAMENKEYLRGIWADDSDDNIFGFGLGWDSVNLYPFSLYNIKALSKGGDSVLYHSNLTVLPEQNMAVAVVSSGGASTYNQVMAQEILLAALKEKGVIDEIKPYKTFTAPEKTTVPTEMKKYEGIYPALEGFIEIKIDEAGTLSLSYPQIPQYGTQTFIYTGDGTFVSGNGAASFRFVEEINGKTYLEEVLYQDLPLLGQIALNLYVAQKVDVNKLPECVSKAWAKREGKKYYLLNEKYSSVVFMFLCPNIQISYTAGLEGYLGRNKIVDKNTAVAILDGPGLFSRDQCDFRFYTRGNVEYISENGRIFIEEAAIKTLSTKNKFTCTIDKDGYAKWYKIGNESAGKEIIVQIPKHAAFAVYDSNEVLVNDSHITGVNKVTLPKEGTIVFLGDAQAEFTVEYNSSKYH